jgi:AraC-like DNA-binding protein
MTVSFSTATVDQRSQLGYWREVVCATFTWLDVMPMRQRPAGFRAEVTAEGLGGMRVATVDSEPHAVFRSPEMIRTAPDDDIFVNLPVRGRAIVSQDGRDAVLRPGDFTVYDSARPCLISCPDPFRLVVLKIPRSVFASHYRLQPGATATAIPGDRGVGALFSSLLRGVPAHVPGLPPEVVEQVGGSVLELLVTALSERASGARPALPREAQLLRARRYITDHLSDPDLAPPAVAAALGLSVRYLHELFRADRTSPSRWILQRRLEAAARLLGDARQAGRAVTDIAYSVGFKDAAHFSRAFSGRYGLGPRAYREARRRDA